MRRKIPYDLDRRIIVKFAIIPVYVSSEWRWLEWVKIEQIYSKDRDMWFNIRFID